MYAIGIPTATLPYVPCAISVILGSRDFVPAIFFSILCFGKARLHRCERLSIARVTQLSRLLCVPTLLYVFATHPSSGYCIHVSRSGKVVIPMCPFVYIINSKLSEQFYSIHGYVWRNQKSTKSMITKDYAR